MSYITSLNLAIIVEDKIINVFQDLWKWGGCRLLVDVYTPKITVKSNLKTLKEMKIFLQ